MQYINSDATNAFKKLQKGQHHDNCSRNDKQLSVSEHSPRLWPGDFTRGLDMSSWREKIQGNKV